MARKHLSDQEIQLYLDNLFSNQEVTAPNDLKIDAASRKKLEKYTALYGELNKDIPLQLSEDFSNKVMSGIALTEYKAFEFWQALLAVLGFGVGIGATFYLNGFKFLSTEKFSLSKTVGLFTGLSNFLSSLSLDAGLIGIGLFMMLALAVLDYVMNHSSRRVFSLFK